MKNYNIKKAITLLTPLLLISCSSKEKVIENSVFTKPANTNIILEKPYINNSWQSVGGNTLNNIGHIGGKKSYKKLFSNDIGSVSKTNELLYPPVANETTVFTIDSNLKITATDINTGKTLWNIKDISKTKKSHPGSLVLSDDFLYVISDKGQLLKINAKTGEILYSKYLNTKIRSGLQFCNNKLFFISDYSELYIIDALTGEKLYTHKTMEEATSFIKGSTPACINDTIIAAFQNGEVHALNTTTLKPIWLSNVYKINKADINNISDIVANPIINENNVIIKSYNNITKSLDIKAGQTNWQNSNGGLFSGVISNNTMFDVNNNKVISATNTLTGKSEWETKLEIQKGEIIFTPILINNQLVIPVSNGNLIKINPYTGKIIEIEELTSKINVDPIVIKDKLIIISNDNLEIFN